MRSDDSPAPKIDIASNYDSINKAANLFLNRLGASFTNTKAGHIQTDIAGAGSVAGVLLLRAAVSVTELNSIAPGTIVISDVYDGQKELLNFMMTVAHTMDLDPQGGWGDEIEAANGALYSTLDLTHKLEKPFGFDCSRALLMPVYRPYAAALSAIKLVSAGAQLNLLDPNVGKSIAFYSIVAGSKTAPHPLTKETKSGLQFLRDRYFSSFSRSL